MVAVVFISLIFLVSTPHKCLGGKIDNDTVTSIDVTGDGFGSGSAASPECLNAQLTLAANQPCFKAAMKIAEKLNPGNRLPLSDNLREYCSPSCRKLNLQLSDACFIVRFYCIHLSA